MGRKSRLKAIAPSVTPRADAPAPQPRVPRPRPASRASLFIAVALAVLTFAVYAQVNGHEFINFDDDIYITGNVDIQKGLSAEGIGYAIKSMDVNWHPTTWLTYLIDIELFGVNSGRIHLVNLLFHIANTVLLFFLLARMTGAMWRSAIVAALFAVHPLHVESVAWVSERKDVVSTLFLLIAIWLYVSWTRTAAVRTYVFLCIAFVLGLAAKQMLVTLPFVLLLLDYWPLQRLEKAFVKRVTEKIPLFAIMVWGVIMSVVGQKAIGAIADEPLPLGTRLMNAIASYGRYLWKTILPVDLAIPYPYTAVDPVAVIAGLIVLAAFSFLAFAVRNTHRYLFTGWFWFVGTLVPVIGIMQIGSQSMADRYTYIPHIGLFLAVVWLVADFARRRSMQQVAAAAAALVIAVLSFLTFRQTARWHDSETLFTHALNVTSNNFIAHLHLATAQKDKARYDQALENYRAAYKIKPNSPEAREGLSGSLIEMAKLDRARGNDPEAMKKLDEAQTIAGDDDEKTRAAIALAKNDVATAVELYRSQLAKSGTAADTAKAHNDLGAALASAGKDEEAVAEYRKALGIAPLQYDARMNLGAILSRLERNDEAIVEFQAATAVQPQSSEPHVYLALAYQLAGRFPDALASARRAFALDPKASNIKLTTAVRMPYKDTNFEEFIAFLERKAAGT